MSLFSKPQSVTVQTTADGAMSVQSAIETRRSTRKYADKPVEKELVEKVIEAGRYAPSGGNSQTTRFVAVTNREVLDELANLVQEEFAKMSVTPGMYKSLVNSVVQSKAGRYRYDYHAPVLVILANKKDYGNNLADSACAAMNMMLEANALDLGTCWINQLHWLTDNERVFARLKELGVEEDETITAALAVGYPATADGLPNRLPSKRKGNPVTWVE